jgi:hypothetical protein
MHVAAGGRGLQAAGMRVPRQGPTCHMQPAAALKAPFSPPSPTPNPQGISAIENMLGRPHVLNHNSVPAACFTHPEARPLAGCPPRRVAAA